MKTYFGLAFTLLSATVSATDVNTKDFYPLSAKCSDKTDCYGCTLNNCVWDGKTCTGTVDDPSLENLVTNGKVCGDQLGVCRMKFTPKDGCGNGCPNEY